MATPSSEASKTVRVDWNDLDLVARIKKGKELEDKKILSKVSGFALPGELLAIMGPSGAGKTTFMNVLCGKATYGTMTGQVFFNNGELDLPTLKQGMGFVPQDDIVHEQLTVRENIFFSAQLRNPDKTSAELLEEIVEDVLNVMQMTHIQNSVVGGVEERGISGGQRKRVNIGLELASCPTVLYLDEPTSGLDSTSSLQIINSLSKMARLQMTIAMVIHQPRYPLFSLFDDVLLLGPGGRTVYLGPSQGAKVYFTGLGFEMPDSENPADWLMDVLSGVVPNERIADFKPAMLFELWGKKSDSIRRDQARRSLTALEDSAVLVSAIEEEWDKIDRDASGSMDGQELRLLLQTCGEKEPHPDAVAEMLKKISTGKDFATKQDMVNFVHALRGVTLANEGRAEGQQEKRILVRDEVRRDEAEGLLKSSSFAQPKPGLCRQCCMLLQRRLAQFMRESRRRLVDVALVVLCGLGIGLMHKGKLGPDTMDMPSNLLMALMGLALLIAVSSLHVFGENRAVFWRESASGISVSAFFLAKVLGHTFDVLLLCSTYVLTYFMVTRPPVPYMDYLVPGLLLSFSAAACSFFISTLVQPQNAMTAAVIFILVGCGILGNPFKMKTSLDGGVNEVLTWFSLTRWAFPMILSTTLDHADEDGVCTDPKLTLILESYKDAMFDQYTLRQQSICALSATTLLATIGAFIGLKFTNRHKQV